MIFGVFFKVGMLILAICFLLLLEDLIDNLGNGRYQFEPDGGLVMDTKTGQLYRHDNYGQLEKVR